MAQMVSNATDADVSTGIIDRSAKKISDHVRSDVIIGAFIGLGLTEPGAI